MTEGSWDRLRAEGFTISDDAALIDFDVVHGYLTQAYWSPGVSRDQVKRAAENSDVFWIYFKASTAAKPAQVGYARVLSDYASLAYLMDVFVLPAYRGKGLAAALTETILSDARFTQIRRWKLATRDAHRLYEKFGFNRTEPGKDMIRLQSPP